jgi:hypothetical protein
MVGARREKSFEVIFCGALEMIGKPTQKDNQSHILSRGDL